MVETGVRYASLAAFVAAAMAIPAMASGGDVEAAFVMPPVLQLQAANGLSDEDVLRIVARDNLMLTSSEAARIEAALNAADGLTTAGSAPDEPVPGQLAARRSFRLDALLYFSPSSWSLWLNGVHITPANVPPDMRINAISRDYVEIVWLPDPGQPDNRRIFTLRANQVYMADTDRVIDNTEAAPAEPEYVLPPLPIEDVTPQSDTTVQRARPEELTLTRDQIDQLRELEDALEAQE